MKRFLLILQLGLLGSLAFLASSCESDDPFKGPSDNTSSLPWNRPMPGERSSPLTPFQSH